MGSLRLSVVRSLFLSGAVALSGIASAEPTPVATNPAVSQEQLLLPKTNAAMSRAQKTLLAAHQLFATQAEGTQVERMGFGRETVHVGPAAFRNELVLYKNNPDGTKTHIGYAMEMNVGREKNDWVPIVMNRRGRIHNKLFLGSDSVFAKGGGKLPGDLLTHVGATDLASAAPLDHAAKWSVRRQTRTLGSVQPARVGTPKLVAPK